MSDLIRQKGVFHRGFTLVELIVALSILGILCSIAIPAFSGWLPDYKLKGAVRDLYSNMQLTKMLSIKQNDSYRLVFNTGGEGSYKIVRPDGTTEKSITFRDYDKSDGIGFGKGKATKNATTSGGLIPADGVSYQYNKVSFNPRGIASGMGYAYLRNNKGTVYAIGSWISGIIVLKKWNEATGKWE
jgi:prepilin-type N-terminal cleavage/methylation domain-containing protein